MNIKTWYDNLIKRVGVSASALKVFAMAVMFVDHTAFVFLPSGSSAYYVMRLIGRLAFPIFAFFVAEGMAKTKNIWMYAIRLFACAVIAELPYNFVMKGEFIALRSCNDIVCLLIPVVMEAVLREIRKLKLPKALYLADCFFVAVTAMASTYILGPSYSYPGVVLVCCFYYLRKKPILMHIVAIVFWEVVYFGTLQVFSPLALPFILLYNGKRGFINTRIKGLACYAFYPLHLGVLFLIRLLIY